MAKRLSTSRSNVSDAEFCLLKTWSVQSVSPYISEHSVWFDAILQGRVWHRLRQPRVSIDLQNNFALMCCSHIQSHTVFEVELLFSSRSTRSGITSSVHTPSSSHSPGLLTISLPPLVASISRTMWCFFQRRFSTPRLTYQTIKTDTHI